MRLGEKKQCSHLKILSQKLNTETSFKSDHIHFAIAQAEGRVCDLSEKCPASQSKFGIKSYLNIFEGTWEPSLQPVSVPVKQDCWIVYNISISWHFKKLDSNFTVCIQVF